MKKVSSEPSYFVGTETPQGSCIGHKQCLMAICPDHVSCGQVLEATLVRKLTEHVERIDTDMACPAHQGIARVARVSFILLHTLG